MVKKKCSTIKQTDIKTNHLGLYFPNLFSKLKFQKIHLRDQVSKYNNLVRL